MCLLKYKESINKQELGNTCNRIKIAWTQLCMGLKTRVLDQWGIGYVMCRLYKESIKMQGERLENPCNKITCTGSLAISLQNTEEALKCNSTIKLLCLSRSSACGLEPHSHQSMRNTLYNVLPLRNTKEIVKGVQQSSWFARAVKGSGLRSLALKCAWVRTPQSTINKE